MSPNYPRSSEWPKNLWIAPDRANRTLILPAWSNKQPELRLEEGREGGRRNVWCDQGAPGREMMMVVAVVTITICSEHTRNLSPLSLPAPPATLLSWHWIFLSQPRWKPVSQSFGAAEDVWDVNKQDVDWRHFMMLPSALSGTGPLLSSPVVRWPVFCGHQSKPRLVTLSSLAWHIVCLENTDRQTGRHRATNIWGNKWGNYLLKRLHLGWPSHPGCVLVCNLWFWIRLRVMTVTWTNQIWQKIISWPSFDLQILKTGIISMLGARLVNR